ncbi:carboxypeptidase regulatory-like domain-containing protein [Chelatococcus sp. GCM10030263]|uniref:carboxypeptidase regulatory-like domain-containing protein n=1 Tax=Chelatococcus sp. GCM10030263 TaxID=3273387 RepID=UPI00360BC0DF
MLRLFILTVVFSGLAACQTATPTTTFDATAASRILKQGTGRVEGSLFLRSYRGRIVRGAGEEVELVPVTAYAEERMALIYGRDKYRPVLLVGRTTPPDPVYETYKRKTKADIKGNFAFDHVAPGDYFVVGSVTWPDPDSLLPGGGFIYDRVTVMNNETSKVVLSGH